MSLSFQNKLIFPAPENSYTVETSQNQVVYFPRDIMHRASRRQKLGYPSNKTLYNMIQGELKVKNEPKKKKEEKVKPLSLMETSSSSDTEQED